MVPIAEVSHPQKTTWIDPFATVIAGASIDPSSESSSFAAFAVLGATSNTIPLPEKLIATILQRPDDPLVKAYDDGSPSSMVL